MTMVKRGLALILAGACLIIAGHSAEHSSDAAVMLGGFMACLGVGVTTSELKRSYYRHKAMSRLDEGTL